MTNAYTFLIDALSNHLNDDALASLDTPQALASWYDDIDRDGHLHVAARFTNTGNPMVLIFAAKNHAEIETITVRVRALLEAGEEDAAHALAETSPAPVWGARK